MLCPKCKAHEAYRSHRHGIFDYLASALGFYPYHCHGCDCRFRRFRFANLEKYTPAGSTEREIRSTRSAIEWKRRRREFVLYGIGVALFLVFLRFIIQEKS